MASKTDLKPLIHIGPAKGLDASSGGDYFAPGDGLVVSNVDTDRLTGNVTNALGRTQIVQFPNNAFSFFGVNPNSTINYMAPYSISSTQELYLMSFNSSGGQWAGMGYFIPNFNADVTEIVTYPANVTFNQAIQFNGTMYTNSGLQYNYNATPTSASEWQFPAPFNAAYTGGSAQTMVTHGSGATTLPAGTYFYAFTLLVTPPGTGTQPQETTPVGALVVNQSSTTPYPFWIVTTGSGDDPVLSPNLSVTYQGITQTLTAWSGTLNDGSTYVTNAYRFSLAQPTWYLRVTLTGSSTFTDAESDATLQLQGSQQLILNQDPPPLSASATNNQPGLGVIFTHLERVWVFSDVYALLPTVNQLAVNYTPPASNYQWQSQLWYSNLGTPWQFNSLNQVLLVGNSSTVQVNPTYSGFGDYPVNGISLGSIAVVFKNHTTWGVFGNSSDTFVVSRLFDIGCQARESVISYQGTIYWLAETGFYAFNGGAPQYLSAKVRNLFRTIPSAALAQTTAFADNLYVYFTVPGYYTFCYYTQDGNWSIRPYYASTGFSVPANINPYALQFGDTVGVRNTVFPPALDQWFSNEWDLAQPTTATWTTPITSSGFMEYEKSYEYISFNIPNFDDLGNAQTGTVSWTLTIDPGSTVPKVFTGTFNVGAYQGGQQRPLYTYRIGSNPLLASAGTANPPEDFKGIDAQLTVVFTNDLGGSMKTTPTKLSINSITVWGIMDRRLVIPD